MSKYHFGDYVIFENYGKKEIGRVTEDRGESAFVCYHDGCTAACTPKEMLRRATPKEVSEARAGIGYHRFDAYCPDRIDEYCHNCNSKKASE